MCARVRRVRASDKEDILEMSRHTWDGYDYLPSVIDEWLNDPASHIYGIKEAERLVAVANLRLVDSGRTAWMEGLRVHPDCRRKGYAHVLTRRLLKRAKILGVTRLRYTTSTENAASLRLADRHGFARVLEMSVFWRPLPKTRVARTGSRVLRMSRPADVYALVQADPALVPHNVVVFDWKALDCTLDGLEHVGESHAFFTSQDKKKAHAFSYGTLRHRGETALWVFTIYASSSEGFLAHLWRHVAAASERGCSAVMGTYGVKFARVFRDVDWGPRRHWGTRLVLLERAA